MRGTNRDNACGFVTDALVEDVEVTRDGKGDNVVAIRPRVADLLVVHARTECPDGLRLLRLNIPYMAMVK